MRILVRVFWRENIDWVGEEVTDVNCVSKDMGMRPLHFAAAGKSTASVASLLSKGVTVDAADTGTLKKWRENNI